jgi:hypothetical protein
MANSTSGNEFGVYTQRKIALTAGKQPVILEITSQVTGYTCQFIYGTGENKYQSIVVPTYKLNVKKDGSTIASYNVTRDSWYCRGKVTEGGGWFGIGGTTKIQLSNRCFEPQQDDMNYRTVALEYPHGANAEALALRSKGSTFLDAVPHTKEMQTFVDGKPIDDARKSPYNKTSDVMIHIGGFYNAGNKNKLAGSYGCFGLTPKAQISSSKAEAEKLRKNDGYKNFTPSNEAYKKAFNTIIQEGKGREIWVNIKKRSGVLTIINE